MHPALRIHLYLVSALALPGLSLFALVVAAATLALVFAGRLGAMLRLTWRARWLFILLGVGHAYGLPGPAAWPAWGDWSPSLAGLHAGGLQMLRLLLLLWALDALVVAMGSRRMLAGLHGLFAGFGHLGFPAERLTVRLGLTLQAMERNSMKLRNLAALLASAGADLAGTTHYTLHHEAWRRRDSLLLAAALVGLLALWLV
ncbi:MAG: hypothetical protein PHS77_01265 [Gallionellaceae bacterium]|nr:hypothetical protein [Gallionellaceae bacterium]